MTQTAEKAYREIKLRIVNGRLPNGTRVTEIDLADELDMSRTPVREALRKLVDDRWLEYTPNVGMRVREWSKKDVLDNFYVRQILESQAVQLATQHISKQGIESLKVINAQLHSIAGFKTQEVIDKMTELNLEFHKGIWNSTDNRVLSEILFKNINIPTMVNTYKSYDIDTIRESLNEHDLIIDCFEAGKAEEAKRIMTKHLQRAADIFQRP